MNRRHGTPWNATHAVLILTEAGAKCASLAFRFGIEVAAAWVDAAHEVAWLWRTP